MLKVKVTLPPHPRVCLIAPIFPIDKNYSMTPFLFELCFLKSRHLTQRSPTRHGTGIFKAEPFLSDFLRVSHHQELLRS